MAIKDTDRNARANYKKKVVTVRVELYGTDEDIREHVEKLKESGESVQGYIKDLIRADMRMHEVHKPLVDRAVYVRAQEKLREKQQEANTYVPPLGYKMQGGLMVKDEKEAAVVKRAFEEMSRDGEVSPDTEREIRRIWKQRLEELRRKDLPRISDVLKTEK